MKTITIRYFCADRVDVITKHAVITNIVIKRVHCNSWMLHMKNCLTRILKHLQVTCHHLVYLGISKLIREA